MPRALDAIDLKILAALQREGRITKTALAEQVGLSPPPCWERLKRLEKAGLIKGYHAEIDLAQHHLAPNGYLHAGVIVTLADTCCGFGVRTGPNGTDAFTTIELKANFLSTVLDGTIVCEARPLHRGRTTEVWDATVTQGERTLASFRCTQLRLSR